jgi:hypothetical protein
MAPLVVAGIDRPWQIREADEIRKMIFSYRKKLGS